MDVRLEDEVDERFRQSREKCTHVYLIFTRRKHRHRHRRACARARERERERERRREKEEQEEEDEKAFVRSFESFRALEFLRHFFIQHSIKGIKDKRDHHTAPHHPRAI